MLVARPTAAVCTSTRTVAVLCYNCDSLSLFIEEENNMYILELYRAESEIWALELGTRTREVILR
jgi:hypothetical protein